MERNMLSEMPLAARKPLENNWDWGIYLPQIAQSLRTKKYPYPDVSPLVIKDPVLNRAIIQVAEEVVRERNATYGRSDAGEGKEPRGGFYLEVLKQQTKLVLNLLKDMRSTLSNVVLSITSSLLYGVLPCFLSGMVAHKEQIKMLKTAMENSPGIPVIFMPLHRSYLDYVLVTFTLNNNDIRSPLVAASNNLQIPVFGYLLRGMGAFFVKRETEPIVGKKNILYEAVLQSYLRQALKVGHYVEFFPEGGRSRTGKPSMPKEGILLNIVNAFMEGSIPDALLVPVSVNYERLVDGNFVREQRGGKEEPETFKKTITGIWKAFNSNFGLASVNFNQPHSLKELVQSYNEKAKNKASANVFNPDKGASPHNPSTSTLHGTDAACEEHQDLVENIARQVIFDAAAVTSVMTTNAVAFLLLTRYRQGATLSLLSDALEKLRDCLPSHRTIAFSGKSEHVVIYACETLGKTLIDISQTEEGETYIQPVLSIDSFIELSYYSNMLTPHFALQSILMITFHNLLPRAGDRTTDHNQNILDDEGMNHELLLKKALENCEIFRYEFILTKPGKELEELLQVALDQLINDGIIKTHKGQDMPHHLTENRRLIDLLSHCFDGFNDDSDLESINGLPTSDLFYNHESLENQKALCEVLAPLGQTYLVVAQNLGLLRSNSMLESEYVKCVLTDLTNKHINNATYAESISSVSVQNCLKLLEKWAVVQVWYQNGLRLLSLASFYESSIGSLRDIVCKMKNIVPNYKNGYF